MTVIKERSAVGETIVTSLKPATLYEKLNGRVITGWKVWTPTVSLKSSVDKWINVPDAILVLKKFYTRDTGDKGRELCGGHDAYIYDHTSGETPKLGILIPDDEYSRIYDLASNDTEEVTTII